MDKRVSRRDEFSDSDDEDARRNMDIDDEEERDPSESSHPRQRPQLHKSKMNSSGATRSGRNKNGTNSFANSSTASAYEPFVRGSYAPPREGTVAVTSTSLGNMEAIEVVQKLETVEATPASEGTSEGASEEKDHPAATTALKEQLSNSSQQQ